MSTNGKLTASELTTVQPGIQLSNTTAKAWLAMKADFERANPSLALTIAVPIGGYRDYFVQGDMKKNPSRYGLNPASTVGIAGPGYSSHGLGTAVDVGSASADGTRKRWLLANASRYGFSRQFGESDPNHYRHNGADPTAVRAGSHLTRAQADALAGWLGRPYNSFEYWHDLQTQGNWNGVYSPKPDGKPGPNTFNAELKLWEKFLAPKPPVVVVSPEPKPYQRVVNAGGVSIRTLPTSGSTKVGFFPPGEMVSMVGWIHGEKVNSLDIWFKFADGKWCWAGGFTSASTDGLVDLNPVIPDPEPEPTPEPEPEPPVVIPEPTQPPNNTPNWIIQLITTLIKTLTNIFTPKNK